MKRRDLVKLCASGLAGLIAGGVLGYSLNTPGKTITSILTSTETTLRTFWRTTTLRKSITHTSTVTETHVVNEVSTTTTTVTREWMVTAYPEHSLPTVESWAYQLQNAEPSEVLEAGFKLIVMDYSRDGTDDTAYSRDEIQTLRQQGIIPIAYLSIGEAEDYRFYWRDKWSREKPEWLGKENPLWPGNYKVRYWHDEWQRIVIRYLDKIIMQGFAGVYLDLVDAFEYWSDPGNGEGVSLMPSEAAGRMISFIAKLSYYARVVKKLAPFYVIPQNGENILEHDVHGIYLATISAIGVEDLWYNEKTLLTTSYVNTRLEYLKRILSAGKPVLSVDYVDDGTGYVGGNRDRIEDYIRRARSVGFIPYVARVDRELDELVVIEGVQPPRS